MPVPTGTPDPVPPANCGAQPDTRMTCMEVWGGSEPVDATVTLPGLDAWVYSRPYGENAEAGGDVYYVSTCATGRINRLLVADISGHGVEVRDIAVSLRDLMRQFVNYLDQAQFIREMNRRFVECSQDAVFATAVVTTFFAPTRTLSVCNAGHPSPLIYRAAKRRWSLLDESGEGERLVNIPLGIMDMESCEQFGVELDIGDLVLVYTDSLVEARAPSGEMLGTDGLLKLVGEMSGGLSSLSDLKAMVPAMLAEIDRRTDGGLRADDVTALLLHANGTGARVPFKDRMMAPVRILKGVYRSLRRGGPSGFPEFGLVQIGGAMFGPLNRLWGRRK